MNEVNAQSGNVYLMTFVYGALSVVTFGLVPSMLHRMGVPRVPEFALQRPAGGAAGILGDMFNVCTDIAAGVRKGSEKA